MKHDKVRRRDESFTDKTATRIWEEVPSADNPYLAETCRLHGYDAFELLRKRSFIDVLYLLFRSELPTRNQSKILESLMVGLINLGPRHSATRASMSAGIGKTDPLHILPIGLLALTGNHMGAGEVESCMRFLKKHQRRDPGEVALEVLAKGRDTEEEDWHPVPGFGSRFGDVDITATRLASSLLELPDAGELLRWSGEFAATLNQQSVGWLYPGVAAAVFADLGFQPRSGGGLFQLLCAPGLLAHGVELANKPFTAMPFVDDDHYIIEK
ncbi:MAG: citrate synthase [Gammaproteobacteria bacterium]|nr:citrate synthase [Gammaproteobacteria bacterium]